MNVCIPNRLSNDGVCLVLEQASVSHSCIQEVGPLKDCPNLLDIDVSKY